MRGEVAAEREGCSRLVAALRDRPVRNGGP